MNSLNKLVKSKHFIIMHLKLFLKKIISRNFEYSPLVKWKICQIRLQNVATNMDFDKLQSEQMIAQDLLKENIHLNGIPLKDIELPDNLDLETRSRNSP